MIKSIIAIAVILLFVFILIYWAFSVICGEIKDDDPSEYDTKDYSDEDDTFYR
jgi:hypothetical protein